MKIEQFTSPTSGQPLWLRALNGAGRLLPMVAKPDAAGWWKAARKGDLGQVQASPDAVEALEALVDSLRSDARLHIVGRYSAADDTIRMARTHLRTRRALARRPEILETPLPPPVFILGWPRTGTTYLHMLLASAPDARSIPYWESFDPVPPEDGVDRRREKLARMLKQLESFAPNYHAIHPMTPEMTEECVALFMNAFRTFQYDFQYRVPGYVRWLSAQDPAVAYGAYEMQLRLIQYHRPAGARFVLKDPTHLLHVPEILRRFPNARLIFTHRDPAVALSSLCSLYAWTRAIFSDDVDPRQLGQEVFEGYWADAMQSALHAAADLSSDRVAHVRQADLAADPIGTARAVHERLSLGWTDETEAALRAFVREEAAKPPTSHQHSLGGFGLGHDEVRERYRSYCASYDL